nr:TonB-dependent receptor [Sphingomonas sp. PAMC 26617]
MADGRYSIGGFARNLLDRKYLIDAGNTGGGFGIPTYIRGEPRVYGVEVSGRF